MKPIINNIDKIFGKILPIGLIIFGVSSCSVSQQTSRENDGIYYDPTAQPTQEVVVQDTERQAEEVYTYQEEQPVRMGGKYFDEGNNAPQTQEEEEEETYEESAVYYDDRVIVSGNNDDYIQWGENQGVDIYINNYYPGYNWYPRYYSSWYNPRFSWTFGWNYWNFRPWYSGFYGYGGYGFGYPYYGYGGFYGPYSPYYGYYGYGYPYYSNYYGNPYYNNYYGTRVMREVYRGKGIQNGITRDNVDGQRDMSKVQPTINRNVPVNTSIRNTDDTRRTPITNDVRNQTITPERRNDANISNDVNTSPVRIRPRTTQEVNTNSGVRTNNTRTNQDIRQNTPIRQTTPKINTPRPDNKRNQYTTP